MFKTLITAIAATALTTTPVAAQTNANFTGPRVEAQIGVRDLNVTDVDFAYGGSLGYDYALNDRITIGGEVNTLNTFDNEGRELGAAVRVGYAINPIVLGYARVGYTNLDVNHSKNLDGITLGGGVNFALPHNMYAGLEYRYTDYQRNVSSNGGLLNVGLRF
jgi:outer membrane immunogenic protein